MRRAVSTEEKAFMKRLNKMFESREFTNAAERLKNYPVDYVNQHYARIKYAICLLGLKENVEAKKIIDELLKTKLSNEEHSALAALSITYYIVIAPEDRKQEAFEAGIEGLKTRRRLKKGPALQANTLYHVQYFLSVLDDSDKLIYERFRAQLFERISQYYPHFARGMLAYARWLEDQGDLESALGKLNNITGGDSIKSHTSAHITKGRLLEKMERLSEAEEVFHDVIRNAPLTQFRRQAHLAFAAMLERQEKFEAAREHYLHTICDDKDQDLNDYWHGQIVYAVFLQIYDQDFDTSYNIIEHVIYLFENRVLADPPSDYDRARAYYIRGFCYENADPQYVDLNKAQADFNKALQIFPQCAAFLASLIKILESQYEKSIQRGGHRAEKQLRIIRELYNKAYQLDPRRFNRYKPKESISHVVLTRTADSSAVITTSHPTTPISSLPDSTERKEIIPLSKSQKSKRRAQIRRTLMREGFFRPNTETPATFERGKISVKRKQNKGERRNIDVDNSTKSQITDDHITQISETQGRIQVPQNIQEEIVGGHNTGLFPCQIIFITASIAILSAWLASLAVENVFRPSNSF